jgi:predicted DNA-binding transcriptional regulator AlpA
MSFAPEAFVGPDTVREFLAFESIETIYRLCRDGMPHRRIGRNLRFRLSEIEDWLASNADVGSHGDGALLDGVPPTAQGSPWLT